MRARSERRRKVRPHTVFALLAPAISAAALVGALAPGISNGRASRPPAARVPSGLRDAFGIFDHARSPKRGSARIAAVTVGGQPLPPAAEAVMRNAPGLDIGAAVFTGGKVPTWVVPGASDVCVVLGASSPTGVPSADCGPAATVEQYGLRLTTTSADGNSLLVGLAPDGNPSVSIQESSGATRAIAVIDNVFEVEGGEPRSVTMRTPSGQQLTLALGAPSTAPAAAPTS